MICEKYPDLEGSWGIRGRTLLFSSLEIGFRHLDFLKRNVELTHTDHHHKMVDMVFKNGNGEEIADFLHAWTSRAYYREPRPSLHTCTSYLINLQHLQPFSPRLRHLLILSLGLIGYQGFEQIGGDGFFELLDHLHVCAEDVDSDCLWVEFLLNIIRSTEGIRRLPYSYWELLVELVISKRNMWRYPSYDPHIMESLEEAEEWGRLECWIGVVWATWGPYCWAPWKATNLDPATLSLFRKKSGAYQKLERWIKKLGRPILGLFQQMCEQANLDVAVGRNVP